ncbi:MAG: hypothetical protein K2L10_06855 [Ruminococcus sp.]|nr:hypothetical protein [Ruminococcus sp.]
MSSVEEDNETIKYFELEVCNQFTDVYLKYIVKYQDIEDLNNTAKNNLFFDKVYEIIKSIDDVSSCCGEIDFFSSGGYGYELELI